MKKFTISKKLQDDDFDLLQEKMNYKLPKNLFEFLSKYGGNLIEERFYVDQNQHTWKLGEIKLFTYIYKYIDQIEEELNLSNINLKLLPFAGEEGGWLFCIAMNDNYPVYIFKTTDYSGIDAIQRVAPTFEYFINNLEKSPQIA